MIILNKVRKNIPEFSIINRNYLLVVYKEKALDIFDDNVFYANISCESQDFDISHLWTRMVLSWTMIHGKSRPSKEFIIEL